MPKAFTTNTNFLTVVRAVLRMYKFLEDGKFESQEADDLREEMAAPWTALSSIEQKRIEDLSIDLNESFERRAPLPPAQIGVEAQTKLFEANDAIHQGESDRALSVLREWGKNLPASQVAYFRGRIWEIAGYPEVALAFFEHAHRLEPGNGLFEAMLLDTLTKTSPADAVRRAEPILQNPEGRIPALVIYAANSTLAASKTKSAGESAQTYKRLIPIVEKALARLEKGEGISPPPLFGMALVLLANCHEHLGNSQEAYEYYSRAIIREPQNGILFAARGQLNFGSSQSSAADLREAIRLAVPVVWPYLYLANYYLGVSEFEECRLVCERGLGKPTSLRIQSELWEFLAIAQAGLGYPVQLIRRNFEKAILVDPSNERAHQNLKRLEKAQAEQAPQPKEWERHSESSLRVLQMEEALV